MFISVLTPSIIERIVACGSVEECRFNLVEFLLKFCESFVNVGKSKMYIAVISHRHKNWLLDVVGLAVSSVLAD